MKKIIVLLILAILGIWYFTSRISNKNKKSDEDEYAMPWRNASDKELLNIGRVMISNKVDDCGEYFVKEIENDEYLIACSSDGENWTYYQTWPEINKIERASVEVQMKLDAPY
jgi:hypothetical protein